jgi:hypothetical protein
MKALLCLTLAGVAALAGLSRVQSRETKGAGNGSARDKLIGAWRLASLESPGADGKVNRITDVKGMLLYTRDGHMSVQLMYPESGSSLSNDYVKNGYEASFGSYDVDEQAHTVASRRGIDHEGAGRKEPSASVPVFGWAPDHQIDSARRTLVGNVGTLLSDLHVIGEIRRGC